MRVTRSLAVLALLFGPSLARAQDAGPPDAAPKATEIDFGEEGGEVEILTTDPTPLDHESLLPDRFGRAPDPALEPAGPPSRGPWPWIALSVGGASLAGGVAVHLWAFDAKDQADALPPGEERTELQDSYQTRQAIAIGLYGVGLVSAGLGVYLLLRDPPARRATLSASPDGDGATVWLRGRF